MTTLFRYYPSKLDKKSSGQRC